MKFALGQLGLLLTAAAMLLAAGGCGGQGSNLPGAARSRSALDAPLLLGAGAKNASGVPVGIWVTWTRSSSPLAQGYYLYRDTDSIPDPPPGDGINPALRVNGGAMIAQPGSGTEVSFNDMFACVVGETYYYRVTVVDDLDQESDPSNEVSWTVQGQAVTGMNPTSAYWGDSITLLGSAFGTYDPATDSVQFPAIGGGFVAGIIEQPADWTDTAITVTVPDNAVTGNVQVVIDATIAESDNELNVLNAWIGSITPNPGFLEQQLTITGGNYGDTPGTSVVLIGAKDVTSAVTSWTESVLKLDPPPDTVAGAVRITVNSHHSNLVDWTPRPEILSATPASAQAGEPVILDGRLFEDSAGQVLLDGTDVQAVTDWSAGQITLTLSGSPGAHTLEIEAASGLTSNSFAFTIVDPLSVTMSGLDPGAVYLPATPPGIGVTTAADADTVELVIDGATFNTVTSPFTGLVLPVGALKNGAHQVKLVAHRRAVSAESAAVDVTVYSLVGDIDSDGIVGLSDLAALDGLIGLAAADAAFRPWYDTDNDGVVTEADLSLVGYKFGNMLPPPLP